MNSNLVFTDLDDTIMSTARKQAALETCTPASVTKEGITSGWQNPKQAALWTWLQSFGEVVPVTARTRDSLARVSLPFSDHAIWCHGASVQISGQEDAGWHAQSQALFADMHSVWPKIQAATESLPSFAGARFSQVNDPDFGPTQLDIMLPGVSKNADFLSQIAQDICGDRAWMHVQYDRLTLLPEGIRKERAVAHMIDILRPMMSIGVGDSLSDVPFIGVCDVAVMPTASFVFRQFNTPIEMTA